MYDARNSACCRPRAAVVAVLVRMGLALLAGRCAAAPRIVASPAIIRFGERDAAEVVSNRFVLSNAGDAPLIIGAVRTSCGCTRAEPECRLLQPGEETGLDVRLALRGLQGLQRKSLTVESNDPDTPNLTLWLEGESRSAVLLEPPSYSFGRVDTREPPPPATIRLSGYATNVTIAAASSDNPAFPVAVAPDGRTLTLASPRLTTPGACRGRVRVTLSDPARPALELQLYAWRSGALRVAPETLVFQPGSSPATTRLVIVRPGAAPRFKVTQVDIDGGSGHAEASARPDGSYQVRVEQVIPDSLATNAAVVIRTNLPECPEWRVPLRREGLPPAPVR